MIYHFNQWEPGREFSTRFNPQTLKLYSTFPFTSKINFNSQLGHFHPSFFQTRVSILFRISVAENLRILKPDAHPGVEIGLIVRKKSTSNKDFIRVFDDIILRTKIHIMKVFV